MPSRRRSRNKNLSTNIADVQRRLRYLERRPVRTKLSGRVVSQEAISPRAVGPEQVDFGVPIVKPPGSETNWEDGLANPKDGDLVINPDDGSSKVYDELSDSFITLTDTSKTTTYYQTDEPAGATVGDLWFDTDDGFKLYRYTGSAWVSVQDAAISAAAAAANAAQNTANQKNRIYRQPSEPTGGSYVSGDIWFDTDSDNVMYRYATSSSSTVAYKSLTNNVATLVTSSPHSFVPLEQITVTGVDAVFNGTYTVTAVPTTTSLRYAKTNANVANTSTSGTITNTDGWKVALLGDNALVSIGATKITAGTLDVGVIYAGNINTNQISAGTLAANVIYSGSITTGQITAGTLSAGVIYAGDISATQITSGTLTVGGTVKIQTGSSGARVELTPSGFFSYNASNVATVSIFASNGAAQFTGTITGSTFTSTNYPSGTGMALATGAGGTPGNAVLFNVSGSQVGYIAAVGTGFFMTTAASSLTMTTAGSVVLAGTFNSITLAAAPYLSGSGGNIGGAYGSIRNIFAHTIAPTTEGGDGDLWFVWT